MTHLNRIHLEAWESALRAAVETQSDPDTSCGRLRTRLRSTSAALRDALHVVRRTAAGHDTAQQLAGLQTQRLAEVLDHLPIAYLLTTTDTIIQQANPAAAVMLNLSPRALLGRKLLLFLDERLEWMQVIGTLRADSPSLRHPAMIHPRERMARRTEAIVTPSPGAELALHWMLTQVPTGAFDASEFHHAPLATSGAQ